MVSFIGTYTAKVDDKGRLVFPSAFKEVVSGEGDMRFVIRKSRYEACIEMWSYPEWDRESAKVRERLDFSDPKHRQFWRHYMLDCHVVEPDPKVGRISIPHNYLDAINAEKEVVFFGSSFKIEIWAKDKFESSDISDEEYLAIAGSLSRR